MAQNKIVRHHTIGTGLWLFVLAASMAGWVLALVWVAYLFDGSRRVAMNRRVKRMLFFESRLFWPKYRELLNSTGRLFIRRGDRLRVALSQRMAGARSGIPTVPSGSWLSGAVGGASAWPFKSW